MTEKTPGLGAPFLDQLVDWRRFEDFVREVHDLDPNVVAERDVTEVGRSGAKRQIDVKLTQVLRGETQVTLIECKRWKHKVDRQRVDVLAASVEDLGAAHGVMFTTSGYEPGAEAYAKHKGSRFSPSAISPRRSGADPGATSGFTSTTTRAPRRTSTWVPANSWPSARTRRGTWS